MKTGKIITSAVLAAVCLTSPAGAQGTNDLDIKFLQEIQQQLNKVSGQGDRPISLHITPDKKRKIDLTTSSISFSYGFLKNMENIAQLIATMAHMTAHISSDHVKAPAPDENTGYGFDETTVENFIQSTIRPKYPDRKSPPEAKGPFHNDGPQTIERATYNNPDYTFAINKADILAAEQERSSDKLAARLLKHAGFCPSDYSRMMHFFYENPQRLLGSKHFALDADQWQRIDVVDRSDDPATICSDSQKAMTNKYAQAFNQLQDKIRLALSKNN